MRYTALAVDFDGTIAHDGVVPPHVLDGLTRLRATGRRLLLVTGRELEELLSVFPGVAVFDRVVAENGALLYRPASGEREALGEPPPPGFVEALRRRGVPVHVGRSIVATVEPHEIAVLETIKALGLERQVIFNKGAVMVLPAGVNKASGLARALAELALSARNLVAAGDGENDHALLASAEYSVATANAIDTLKAEADRVTRDTHGDGVLEVVADLIEADLANSPPRRARRALLLGRDARGEPVALAGAGVALVVSGAREAGRSHLVAGLLERLCADGYQFCLLDSHGGYEGFAPAVVFGAGGHAPDATEVITALGQPDVQAVVSLAALAPGARRAFVADLMGRLAALQEKTGRPHWIALDETADMLAPRGLPRDTVVPPAQNMIHVAAEPSALPDAVAAGANAVLACGPQAAQAIEAFAAAAPGPRPAEALRAPRAGEAVVWMRRGRAAPTLVELPRTDSGAAPGRAGVGRVLRRA